MRETLLEEKIQLVEELDTMLKEKESENTKLCGKIRGLENQV